MSKKAWSPGRMIAIGEVVRMGTAALAADRVYRLDVVGAELVEHPVGFRDEVGLAHSGFQFLPQHVVHAVDHRGGRIEQHDLVDTLELARLQHHLLTIADLDSRALQLEQHRRLRQVKAERHPLDAVLLEQRLYLLRVHPQQSGFGRYRAAQSGHPGPAMIVRQPRRVQLVMLHGRAEVPDVGLGVASQQGEADHLVTSPFANHRAAQVADVVGVEAKHRAEIRMAERLARARQPIFVQAAKVHPLFEVDRALAGRRERALPVVMRIERGGAPRIHDFAGLYDSGLRSGSSHGLDPHASTWMHVPQKIRVRLFANASGVKS